MKLSYHHDNVQYLLREKIFMTILENLHTSTWQCTILCFMETSKAVQILGDKLSEIGTGSEKLQRQKTVMANCQVTVTHLLSSDDSIGEECTARDKSPLEFATPPQVQMRD